MLYEDVEEDIKDIIPLNKEKFNSLDNDTLNSFVKLAIKFRFNNMLLNKYACSNYEYIINDIKKI